MTTLKDFKFGWMLFFLSVFQPALLTVQLCLARSPRADQAVLGYRPKSWNLTIYTIKLLAQALPCAQPGPASAVINNSQAWPGD